MFSLFFDNPTKSERMALFCQSSDMSLQQFKLSEFKTHLHETFQEFDGHLSLEIHLPFCEKQCVFCDSYSCVSKDEVTEKAYIQALLKEWDMYLEIVERRPTISELHLTGGTPTFFSPSELQTLIQHIFARATISENCELSFEGNGQTTTKAHLQTLFDLGFRKLSLGIQSFETSTQERINRLDTFHNFAKITIWAKELGYDVLMHKIACNESIQSIDLLKDMLEKSIALAPDYIQLIQIKSSEIDNQEIQWESKVKRLVCAADLLFASGYQKVGPRLFALQNTADRYKKTSKAGSRNTLQIGLGLSAMTKHRLGMAQNSTQLSSYLHLVEEGVLPISTGKSGEIQHLLNSFQSQLNQYLKIELSDDDTDWLADRNGFRHLKTLAQLECLTLDDKVIQILPKGELLLSDICQLFQNVSKKNV